MYVILCHNSEHYSSIIHKLIVNLGFFLCGLDFLRFLQSGILSKILLWFFAFSKHFTKKKQINKIFEKDF